MAQHRRKGDTDDKSHKGHPICEFCDLRYMDNDELYRHLRRDHLYCHFCDADGLHHYYSSYDYLRDHFRKEHYLCEEGPCAEEQFTSVFRSDIDLKAHKANTHGKHLGKAAQKQARLLELEFTLAPRGDNRNGRRPGPGIISAGPSNSRGHSNDYGGPRDYYQSEQDNAFSIEPEIISMRQPDVQSTEEFPSLGNTIAPAVQNLNVTKTKGRGNLTIRGSLKPQTLAIDDENFPALGPETTGATGLSKTVNFSVYSSNKSGPSGLQRPQTATPNVSIQVNHKTDGSITTRVTGPNIRIRPSKLSMDSDFPALGRSESPHSSNSNIGQWTKITCVKPTAKTKKIAPPPIFDSPPPSSPVSFSEAFPSLPKSTRSKKQSSISVVPKNTYSSTWNQTSESNDNKNSTNDLTKVNTKKKKKKKVKPNSSGNNSSGNESSTSKSNCSMSKVQNDNQPSGEILTNISKNTSKLNQVIANNWNDDISSSTKLSESNKGNGGNDIPRKRSELKIDNLNNSTNGSMKKNDDFPVLGKSTKSKLNPPPGFNTTASPQPPPPPPGFAVKLNDTSLDRNDNGLTFTNSSGESYSILPDEQNKSYNYVAPPDFQKRNQNLVAKIREVLGLQESIEEFRYLSGLFRQGSCNAEDYYKRCRTAMGLSAFANVFPEMLVLLPDIDKQRELYNLHRKEVDGKIKSLEICPTCGQIVKNGADLKAHYSTHTLDNHFPVLGEATGISTSHTWTRKGA